MSLNILQKRKRHTTWLTGCQQAFDHQTGSDYTLQADCADSKGVGKFINFLPLNAAAQAIENH